MISVLQYCFEKREGKNGGKITQLLLSHAKDIPNIKETHSFVVASFKLVKCKLAVKNWYDKTVEIMTPKKKK